MEPSKNLIEHTIREPKRPSLNGLSEPLPTGGYPLAVSQDDGSVKVLWFSRKVAKELIERYDIETAENYYARMAAKYQAKGREIRKKLIEFHIKENSNG